MPSAQLPPVPPAGARLRASDWAWIVPYCTRGLFELARARRAFGHLEAGDIPRRNQAAARATQVTRPTDTAAVIARISYVLPRLSAHLPWRSDCLVQAIAAQNWLSSLGLASEIRIGVERPGGTGFGAHAWLVHGEEVVTGGDVDRYQVLLSSRETGRKRSVHPAADPASQAGRERTTD